MHQETKDAQTAAKKELKEMKYEKDAKGKLKKKHDPYLAALKEMRKVEADNLRAKKEREAAQAAKELAFRKQIGRAHV